MCEMGIVESALQSVFPEVQNLNPWRLRVVLNILIMLRELLTRDNYVTIFHACVAYCFIPCNELHYK